MSSSSSSTIALNIKNDELFEEKEFYDYLTNEKGETFVTKIKKKKRGKVLINWYLLHKLSKSNGYDPKKDNSDEIFKSVAKDYVKKMAECHTQLQETSIIPSKLKREYDNSEINQLDFIHDDKTDQDETVDENDPSYIGRIKKHIKKIQNLRLKGEKDIKAQIGELLTSIEKFKLENIPLPKSRDILFYGGSGSGKSTLINLILFATTQECDNYNTSNSSIKVKEFESIRFAASKVQYDHVEAFKSYIVDKWDILNGNENFDEEDTADSYIPPFSLVQIDKNIEFEANNVLEEEKEFLERLSNGDKDIMHGEIKPYILDLPQDDVQGSCTAHLTTVRYGSKWQAVIEFKSFKEIFKGYDNLNKSKRTKLMEAVLSINPDLSDNETSSSSSKRIKEDTIPESKKDAERYIPPKLKDFIDYVKGIIILSVGKNSVADRLFVRYEIKKIMDKLGPIIKEITIFAPSSILNEQISLVDAPGCGDADNFKGMQLKEAIGRAKSVVYVSCRDPEATASNVENFAKNFVKIILKKSLPTYVYVRTLKDKVSSVDQIKEKQKDQIDQINDIKKLFVEKVVEQAKNLPSYIAKEHNKAIEKNFDMYGGNNNYVWCAMRYYGKSFTNNSNREENLELSGFGELLMFLRTKTGKNNAKTNAKKILEEIKQIAENINKNIDVDLNIEIWSRIKKVYILSNDSLRSHFEEVLEWHPFFKRTIPPKNSNHKIVEDYEPLREIEEKCDKMAYKICYEIGRRLNGEYKQIFVSGVNKWNNSNIEKVTSDDVPNIEIIQEYRIFPEAILPVFDKREFSDFKNIFQENLLLNYLECADKAIVKSVFKIYIETNSWRSERTRSQTLNLPDDYDSKVEEALLYDKKFKETKDYIESFIKNDLQRNNLKNRDDILYRRVIFENAIEDIKIYFLRNLREKITHKASAGLALNEKINGEDILKITIEIFNHQNIKKVLINSVERSYIDAFKELFNSFASRSRAPILESIRKNLCSKPLPAIHSSTKESLRENIKAILKICDQEINEDTKASSSS